MLWYVHTLRCTWGIIRPLHIKCQCSSSYYVDKNRYTVERAGMTVALPILCCSLHYWLQRWAMHSKLTSCQCKNLVKYCSLTKKKCLLSVFKHVRKCACICFSMYLVSLQDSNTSNVVNESSCKMHCPLMFSSVIHAPSSDSCNFLQSALLKGLLSWLKIEPFRLLRKLLFYPWIKVYR